MDSLQCSRSFVALDQAEIGLLPGDAIAADGHTEHAALVARFERHAAVVHEIAACVLEDRLGAVGRSLPGTIDADGHAAGDRLVQLEAGVLQPVDEECVDE